VAHAELRHQLLNDYKKTSGDAEYKVPHDDEPFEWHNNYQFMLDWLPEHTSAWNGQEAAQSTEHASVRSPPSKARLTLDSCIQRFAQHEQLGENDKWYCSTCKDHVRAYKKMDLWRLPPVLIVHLKRFQYERGFTMVLRGKIDDAVEYPTRDLDLGPYLKGPAHADGTVYDLFAVSVRRHARGRGGGGCGCRRYCVCVVWVLAGALGWHGWRPLHGARLQHALPQVVLVQ